MNFLASAKKEEEAGVLCWPGRAEGVGFPVGLLSCSLEEVRPLCSQCGPKTVEGGSEEPIAPGGECVLRRRWDRNTCSGILPAIPVYWALTVTCVAETAK